MRAFLLLFLLFPVLELYVFFQVSTAIGFFPALALIIFGSMLGLLVLRVAGIATALRARESLNRPAVADDSPPGGRPDASACRRAGAAPAGFCR